MEWIILNYKKNMKVPIGKLLQGSKNKAVFIFIHGYGSTYHDILPLAHSFNQKGFDCELIFLKEHGEETINQNQKSYQDWINQILSVYKKYPNRKVYLVGFSIGGTIALDFASKYKVAGVLSIGTFLGFFFSNRLAILFLRLLIKLFPKYKFKRKPQTTVKKTEKELVLSKYIPAKSLLVLLKEVELVKKTVTLKVKCPILFFHSVDDRVSDYKTFLNNINNFCIEKYRIITFNNLNHYIQFDVPPYRIRDLACQFFCITDFKKNEKKIQVDFLKETLNQCSERANHWSGILFKIIAGFFTIFGLFLTYTLEKVLLKHAEAPYYLVSYSLIVGLYLLLASLYFFYLNRISAYQKQFIEPLVSFYLPWTEYKRNKWISGEESEKMTGYSTFCIVVLPALIVPIIAVYCLLNYEDRFLVLEGRNVLLQSLLVSSILLWIASIKSGYMVNNFTNRELNQTKNIPETTFEFQKLLTRLYSSVTPGCVTQINNSSKKYLKK